MILVQIKKQIGLENSRNILFTNNIYIILNHSKKFSEKRISNLFFEFLEQEKLENIFKQFAGNDNVKKSQMVIKILTKQSRIMTTSAVLTIPMTMAEKGAIILNTAVHGNTLSKITRRGKCFMPLGLYKNYN